MIKPYFSTKFGSLYLGKWHDLREVVAEKSVDMVLTDPPYNISKKNANIDRSKAASPVMRRESPLKFDFGDWDNMERVEFLEYTQQWLSFCISTTKERATIGSFFNKEDISFLGWEAHKFGVRTRTIISWHKNNPTPSFRQVNYLSACEFIWLGSRAAWKFNFSKQKEMHNFYSTSNASAYGKTGHPTEKPEELLSWLIRNHTDKGDLVFDPFGGSGTTAAVCEQLGRKWVLFEMNKEYCDMAAKRIGRESKQGKLELGK